MNSADESGDASPHSTEEDEERRKNDCFSSDSFLAMPLTDPQRWGWSSSSGVVDLLTPHERARRRESRLAFIRSRPGSFPVEGELHLPTGNDKSSFRPNCEISQQHNSLRVDQVGTIVSSSSAKNGRSDKVDPTSTDSAEKSEGGGKSGQGTLVSDDGKQGDKLNAGMGCSADALASFERSCGLYCDTYAPCVRVGQESRDARTGELLPLETITAERDTNHYWDPNCLARITVRFPITDSVADNTYDTDRACEVSDAGVSVCDAAQDNSHVEDDVRSSRRSRKSVVKTNEPSHQRRSRSSRRLSSSVSERDNDDEADREPSSLGRTRGRSLIGSSGLSGATRSRNTPTQRRQRNVEAVEYFETEIEWDLGSPSTPTPLAFASKLAEEYGLSSSELWDLASDIERQIQAFRQNTLRYKPPVSTEDPFGQLHLIDETDCSDLFGTINQSGTARSSRKPASRVGKPKRSSDGEGRAPVTPKPSRPRVMTSRTKPFNFIHGPEYRDEVLKRLMVESLDDLKQEGKGKLKHRTDYICHVCHTRKKSVIVFGCGNERHALCNTHCETRLNFSAASAAAGEVHLEFCPICVLKCPCPRCCRKLDSICAELKQECALQEKDVASVKMEMLPRSNGSRSNRASTAAPVQTPRSVDKDDSVRSTRQGSRTVTPKNRKRRRESTDTEVTNQSPVAHKSGDSVLPTAKRRGRRMGRRGRAHPHELPYELAQGQLLNGDDRVKNSKWVAAELPENDDGNVDYCMICNKAGGIVCCDHCPRAFHQECVNEAIPEFDDWTCPMCIRDSKPQESDYFSGQESHDAISSAFAHYDHEKDYKKQIEVLCKIHRMVVFLMEFDFGDGFRTPVDLEELPDYLETVETPMDLGTICKKMLNKGYDHAKRSESGEADTVDTIKKEALHKQENGGCVHAEKVNHERTDVPASSKGASAETKLSPLNEVILAVLKDIETVWHNCFLYNQEGSLICRMAKVQRRKYLMMRACSIDAGLDPAVVFRLESFVKKLQQKRKKGGGADGVEPIHVIRVQSVRSGTQRPVVVYDPQSKRIVKSYSSAKYATLAVFYLANKLGYKTDQPLTDWAVKKTIRGSLTDPSLLLFGYRWFYQDEMERGRAVGVELKDGDETSADEESNAPRAPVSATTSVVIERLDKSNTKKCFSSVEDAYHSSLAEQPEGTDTLSFQEFHSKLMNSKGNLKNELDMSAETVSLMGFDWKCTTNGKVSSRKVKSEELERPRNGFISEDGVGACSPISVIVKENINSCAKLGSFDSVQAAYKDWLQEREASGIAAKDSAGIEYFQTRFLHGDENIEGIQWKDIRDSFFYRKQGTNNVEPNGSENKRESANFMDVEVNSAEIKDKVDGQDSTVFDDNGDDDELDKSLVSMEDAEKDQSQDDGTDGATETGSVTF